METYIMRPLLCYLLIPALTLAACQSGSDREAGQAAAYEAAADSTRFSHDITALNSPSRKRVRTADVRCRVSNVFNAALTLERAVAGMNGVVVESSMQNTFGELRDVPYSADSLKRIQLYTPTAHLTLRVPAAGLDSVVHTLTAMASFIDYRTLKEQDKTLDYLANALRNKDSGTSHIVPEKEGTPLDVAAYRDARKSQAIDRKIVNLGILDDVNYATFTVQLFQPQLADVQVVVNPDRITRAGFGTELLTALGNGVDVIRNIVLFLLQLWPFALLAAVVWVVYKRLAVLK
jgi:hypothetical protein